MSEALISVIIPVLDEERLIAEALASAHAGRNVQTVVVDGGSRDRTAAIATRQGATVIHSTPPRARQMNAGAGVATGDALVFLHADAALPAGFADEVRATLLLPGVAAGAFSLLIDSSRGSLRCIERAANWRARRLELPYGDQALFVGRSLFNSLGGFRELPIMEDFEFVRRLRRRGRVRVSPLVVRTSSRRWDALGAWRTTLINQAVIVGYLAGVQPARIARWYDRSGALKTIGAATPEGRRP